MHSRFYLISSSKTRDSNPPVHYGVHLHAVQTNQTCFSPVHWEMSGYTFALNDEAKEFAEKYLNETGETRASSLREIRKWLGENRKLKAKQDDLSLLAFLRGCKFDLERTRTKLTNYYKMKSEVPEWFKNRDPSSPEIQKLLRLGVFVPLRKPHDNKQVVVIRTAAHDPKKHSQDDVFKTGKMILDVLALENERLQIYGVIAIFDMKNISLGHARQLPPSRIKKAVHAWQNYHCRPKQLEFINAPTFINVVLNIFKSFMSEKLKGRVSVHFSGFETLHGVVGKDVLPVEYGGNDGEIAQQIDLWAKKLLEYSDWFKEDEKYKLYL